MLIFSKNLNGIIIVLHKPHVTDFSLDNFYASAKSAVQFGFMSPWQKPLYKSSGNVNSSPWNAWSARSDNSICFYLFPQGEISKT